MPTAPVSAETSRLSFAKVAASAGKDNVSLNSIARIAGSATRISRNENPPSNQSPCKTQEMSGQAHGILNTALLQEHTLSTSVNRTSNEQSYLSKETSNGEVKLLEAVKALNISSTMPNLVVIGSNATHFKGKSEKPSEKFFHRVDSESELGTKPPSLDDKSTTSGTTFALDEKESLRPDDSASVKGGEDDETFSGRGSIVAGSRIGSEAAARAYRTQLYEISDRRNVQQNAEAQFSTTANPQNRSSGQIAEETKFQTLVGSTGVPEGFNLFYRQTPDEKLLEALESAKDRIFLLRLEQDVIEFVRSSKEPFIDLPPCNSFCRMLTHKLADYYHMTHQVDAVAGAVRIFRTPFCRLPPSLTSLSSPTTSGNTPPAATMKIMRRGGDVGPSPSNAMSEAGSEGKDKGLSSKEKLSREEREAAYNRARERIFGKEDKTLGDSTSEMEERNEMSRSSSVSTKDRTALNKRSKSLKQRRDDSENFDSRSQYTPFFPQPQGPTWIPSAQYSPIVPQVFNGNNMTFQGPVSPQCASNHQHFNPAMMGPSSVQNFGLPQQFSIQSSQTAQRFPPHGAQMSTFGSSVQPPLTAPQQWPQAVYHNPFQLPGPTIRGPPSSVPYLFGQLPTTVNPADPKSQHPIPGSFNRHAFNPKTQSFVPGNVVMSVTPQTSHHSSSNGFTHHSSTRTSYNMYSSPQQQFGNGMDYNMVRQGSNNSLLSYHASPLITQRPPIHQGITQGAPPGKSHGVPPGIPQNLSQGLKIAHNGQMSTRLPNYGNPSTLPPKPPTGI
ncbi:hypothetical protein K3495_g84 [Podosphaera aphanis]|nr:hypothetical protein K3495_g84 [Podosphaera aphanis]